MPVCMLCDKTFVVITQIHLRAKHDIDTNRYREMFPDSVMREPFECDNCSNIVTDAVTSRNKYCRECAEDINKSNSLKNVRKFHRKRKKFIEQMIQDANREYGIQLENENSPYTKTRIDATHTGWDKIGNVMNNLGTMPASDLEVTKEGRIKGAVKLEKEIEKYRRSRKRIP